MKHRSKVTKIILTVILAILITIIILLNVTTATILKEEYVLKKLEDNNYYEMAYQEMQITFDRYIAHSGLRKIDSKNIFTKEQVREDIQKVVKKIYESTESKISTDILKENLHRSIENQLEQEILTEHSEQAINQLVDTIGIEYESKIFPSEYSSISIKKIDIFVKSLYIVSSILIIILVLICIKGLKIGAISFLGVSMLTSGIILEFANIFINSKIVIENIESIDKSISTTIQLIENDILSKMLTQSISIIILGIFAIVIGNVLYNKVKKRD